MKSGTLQVSVKSKKAAQINVLPFFSFFFKPLVRISSSVARSVNRVGFGSHGHPPAAGQRVGPNLNARVFRKKYFE